MKKLFKIVFISIVLVIIIVQFNKITKKEINKTNFDEYDDNIQITQFAYTEIPKNMNQIDDWKLVLVNLENELPKDFTVDLANIDNSRQFDSRALPELQKMILDMKKQGCSNIWVQSGYRSFEYQEKLFNKKIDDYIKLGYSREKSEELTKKVINPPGTSEHHLGLAVDFNYVNNDFEKTKEFLWLKNNAENYGFILRYAKEKESITKINYEPWHWRYVGVENAKNMNKLNMCLEEYIEYLNNKKMV